MSVQISPNLPANVVEIGNEISQAKINEINSGTIALQSWVQSQGFATESWVTGLNYITISALAPYATTSWVIENYVPIPGEGDPAIIYDTEPHDNAIYGMRNGQWISITGSAAFLTDAPSDGTTYGRNNGAWVSVSGGSGAGTWGSITGTLSDQTDLHSALDGKADLSGASFGGSVYVTGSSGISQIDTGQITVYDGSMSSNTKVTPTGITFPDNTTLSSSANIGYSAAQVKADGIAMRINYLPMYTNYLGFDYTGSAPYFITNTSWGLVDGSGNYYPLAYISGSYAYFYSSWSAGQLYVRLSGGETSTIPLPY